MKIVNSDWYITIEKCLGISHELEKILIDNDLYCKLCLCLEHELYQKIFRYLIVLETKTIYQLQSCDL
jgi:hypothetical protein